MNSAEKEISYQSTNSYSTLNHRTAQTKNIWFVCHGMGYLSRYFLKYFEGLDPTENYIIAPQAQSKYYLPPKYKHVGSSWLTKENTYKETENVMQYFDAIFEAENIDDQDNLIVVGYSQGVSVSMRYLVKRQIKCSHLVMMSGGIPKELTSDDFSFLEGNIEVSLIYGTEDEYLNEDRIAQETQKAQELFNNKATIIPFEGKHIVNVELINTLV